MLNCFATRLRPARTRIFHFIQQESLLPHCRAVVAHAAAGTLLGALACGVPMLLLPQCADQFYNACRASPAGTAIALMPEDASAEATTTSVERFDGAECKNSTPRENA